MGGGIQRAFCPPSLLLALPLRVLGGTPGFTDVRFFGTRFLPLGVQGVRWRMAVQYLRFMSLRSCPMPTERCRFFAGEVGNIYCWLFPQDFFVLCLPAWETAVWPMLNSCFPWAQGVCPLAVLLGSLTF